MNKIIFIAFFSVVFNNVICQDGVANRSSVDFGIGGTNAVAPYAPDYWSNTVGLFHTYAGYRFMFNNKFGARINVGFDRIKNDEFGGNGSSLGFRSQYFRSSLEVVMNMGRVLNFEDFAPKFSFLFHGGMGYSSNRNSDAPLFGNFDDPNKDNMVNFIVGVTPQYQLGKKFAVNIDLSFVNHIYQQRTWDLTQSHSSRGFDGFMANATIGVSYYFGKNERHFDWKFDEKPPSKAEIAEAVYDKMDAEDLFNKLPDQDKDGIPDKLDACPEEHGLIAHNGCPPPKKDTVILDADTTNLGKSNDTIETNPTNTDIVVSQDEAVKESLENNKKGNNPVEVEAEIYELYDHQELHVVVGMFKSKLNADNFIEELSMRGYEANLVGMSKGLKIVSIGSFDDIKKARKKLNVARSEIIETAWIMKRQKTY